MANPKQRSCAAMQHFFATVDHFPAFRANQGALAARTRNFVDSGSAAKMVPFKQVIPVVVHVVHRGGDDNISDAQIRSQLDVLNADFNGKNKDLHEVPDPFKPFVGVPNIEFRLAREAPDGSPHSGITWTETQVESFGTDDQMKSSATGGVDPWDTARYLNMWVCTLTGGLLGYAQFPGGPPETDGVVITHTAFGTTGTAEPPFHLGRTATHEVGHYLNLRHIWGGGLLPGCHDSDDVDDTPNQYEANTGKPSFPKVSCSNGPHGDMFMNYMDYVDDDAMFMFSEGQVERMMSTLELIRSELISGSVKV